jgi:hypothetical protein
MSGTDCVRRLRIAYDRLVKARSSEGGQQLNHYGAARDALETIHRALPVLLPTTVVEPTIVRDVRGSVESALAALGEFYRSFSEGNRYEQLGIAMASIRGAARALLASPHATAADWQQPRREFRPRTTDAAAPKPGWMPPPVPLSELLVRLAPDSVAEKPRVPTERRRTLAPTPSVSNVEASTGSALPFAASRASSASMAAAQAQAIHLVFQRFLKGAYRYSNASVGKAFVAATGLLVATIRANRRAALNHLLQVYSHSDAVAESPTMRKLRLSERPIYESAFVGSRTHDMAMSIIRGMAETVEFWQGQPDVDFIVVLASAAGRTAKAVGLSSQDVEREFANGCAAYDREGIDCLQHPSLVYDIVAKQRVMSFTLTISTNRSRVDELQSGAEASPHTRIPRPERWATRPSSRRDAEGTDSDSS